jgi:hypothetical protein
VVVAVICGDLEPCGSAEVAAEMSGGSPLLFKGLGAIAAGRLVGLSCIRSLRRCWLLIYGIGR